MPRLSEAMKDVISCDKLRLGAHTCYTRRFPNGATQHVEDMLSARRRTRRTETSKYPEEKKTKVIALVAASERAVAQTNIVTAILGL